MRYRKGFGNRTSKSNRRIRRIRQRDRFNSAKRFVKRTKPSYFSSR